MEVQQVLDSVDAEISRLIFHLDGAICMMETTLASEVYRRSEVHNRIDLNLR